MSKEMILSVEVGFKASHQVMWNGLMEEPHEHDFKITVSVKGVPDKDGMVVNFIDLKALIAEKIIIPLQGRLINEVIPVPTAENIAIWAWDQLKGELNLAEIRLTEAPGCNVAYFG